MSSLRFDGRTIAVTGGSGFIGGHVARDLAERGASVRILDRRAVPRDACAELVDVDLATAPLARLVDALADVTDLVHLAAEKHNKSGHDAPRIYRTNVLGTHALFTAARLASVRRIVFASSLYAYGRTRDVAMAETDPGVPDTAYGTSKVAGERLLRQICSETRMVGVALRFFFVYGPGQDGETETPSLIPATIARLHRGEPAVVRGDGGQILDYVFVDDVVEAVARALQADLAGDIVNVGSGRPTTVREIVEQLQSTIGGEIAFEPADSTRGTTRYANIDRARDRLGWAPRVDLESGLARMIAESRR